MHLWVFCHFESRPLMLPRSPFSPPHPARCQAGILAWTLSVCATLALCLCGSVRAQDSEEDAFKRARNLYRDTDYATASGLFAEFIRNHPASDLLADARLLLARAYKNSQRCDLAIKAYKSFYQEHPEHLSTAEARQERAACLNLEKRYLDAARAYEEIQSLFSASGFAAQALLAAGTNYTYAEKPEQAARLYGKIIAEYSDKPQVHPARYRLAELYFARGAPEVAQALLEDIGAAGAAAPEAPSALLLSGGINLFLGRVEQARKKFARLHQHFGSSAQADSADLELASHLYNLRRFSQAGDAFQIAHQRIKDPDLKLRARLGLADALRQSGQIQPALGHYQALLKAVPPDHPDGGRVRLGLAVAYGQTGEFTAAFDLFQRLIQTRPDTPEATDSFRELGALYQRRGDYNGAITWYSTYLRAVPEAPDLDQVKRSLARIYAQIGYYEQAIPILRELADGPMPIAAAAQCGLAATLEQSDQPQAALREYRVFLERFPAHLQTRQARDRVEYLNHFTVMDAASLNRVYQQAQLDELSGTPREIILLDLAQALYEHHDIENSTRLFEIYVASYPDRPYLPKAQFYLAESLYKLTRKRQLEGHPEQTDSLRQMALREHRILAAAEEVDEWSQMAQIRLVEIEAEAAPDSLRHLLLKEGFALFLANHSGDDNPHRDLALLRLADARRHLGATRAAELDTAMRTYRRLRQQVPQSPLSVQALFGLGLCYRHKGEYRAAADSLRRILRDYPGSPLSAQVLFQLGQLLLQQGELRAAASRFQELLLTHPAFPQHRAVQLQLADTHYRLEDYPAAIALYRQWLGGQEVEDADGRVQRRLARSYHRHGEFEAALQLYGQVVAHHAQAAGLDTLYFNQAVLLDTLGREEEAIRRFLQVRDKFGASPLVSRAAQQAGHLLFALERYDRAYQTYLPLLATTAEPQTHGRAVLALFRLQRLEEARKAASAFAKRFAKDPVWPQRFLLEEGLYYLGKKDYEKAFKKFLKLEEQGGEWTDDGAYHAALALWQQNQGAPSEETAGRALEAQNQFVQNHPNSPHVAEVRLRLGNYYYGLGQYLIAAGNYKAVVNGQAEKERKEEAIWQLVNSYQKAFEHDDAHRTIERLLRDFPDHPDARDAKIELGAILKDKGQYTQAIAHLEKVLEWAQGNKEAEAYLYIGQSYQKMGKYREAISNYYSVSYYGADASATFINTADYMRAQCHEILQEYDTAISVYERIIRREGGGSNFGAYARDRVTELRRELGG